MPNVDMVNGYGMGMIVTDRRWVPQDVADAITPAEFAATQDIRTLDAWLVANNAAYWTAARLAGDNIWDKLFFLRSQVANNAGLA